MKLKRVKIELLIGVDEGTEGEENGRAYGKFMERITKGDFDQEHIAIEDMG